MVRKIDYWPGISTFQYIGFFGVRNDLPSSYSPYFVVLFAKINVFTKNKGNLHVQTAKNAEICTLMSKKIVRYAPRTKMKLFQQDDHSSKISSLKN